jgi:dipeptidyl aminopeptidase/acylaminoacyl peptidase
LRAQPPKPWNDKTVRKVASSRRSRVRLSLIGAPALLAATLAFSSLASPPAANAQNLDKPVMNVDEEVTAFSYAPDGRIVFSVRHMFKTKKYDLQRDDIWLLENNGKRKRLLEGLKFTHGDKPFTYQVESFTWSPNGHIIAIQLFTTTVDTDSEQHDDERARLLLDDNGRELHPAGNDPLVMGAESPMWLRDNGTLVYMKSEVERDLFAMQYLYMSSGPATKVFEGRTFIAAVRIPGSNAAIAVERDRNMDGPPRIQKLDLLSQDDKELATLDAYAGGLSISPSGTKIAYFLDREVLEVRDLQDPRKVGRLRVGLGVLEWSGDENRIYLKRTVEKKSADLVTFNLPRLTVYPKNQQVPVAEPEPAPLLHGLAVREYSLSPDGRFLAVVLPGKRNLQVFGF